MSTTTKSTRTRRNVSGTNREIDTDQMVALFGFIGLHECGTALECLNSPPRLGRRGRKAAYPATALLATLASARVAGSLAAALQLLHNDKTLWQRCGEAYYARNGTALPVVPPSRDQVVYLRDLLIKDPENLGRLQAAFRRVAVGQARLLGNLLPGKQPDWSAPLEEHAIYGDGTNIAKYSEVREILIPTRDGDPQKVLVGSRASKGKPIIQRVATDTSEDDKETNGLNMVAIHTWTSAGRVTLGTAVALGAEQWAALEIVEAIHDLAGDGVHSLIYDRAITGWQVGHLMGNLRVQVIGKDVAGKKQATAWSDTINDADVSDLVDRRIAELGTASNKDLARYFRRDVIGDMLRYHERLPLGLSIYPTSNNNFDLVRSFARKLEPLTHATPTGDCVHRLALDDGGLFEIADHAENATPIKMRVLQCRRSVPVQRPDGRWATENHYTIPCDHGDVDYVRRWEPEAVRYTPESTEKDRASKDPVGWRLRPLSRADDIAAWYNTDRDTWVDHRTSPQPFNDIFGRRNDSESFNQWYQRSLPHHGRAASLSQHAQDLDFLLGALLSNCNTWQNRRP